VIEDVRDAIPPVDGPDLQLSIDSKIQFFAHQKLREAVAPTRPRPAVWW
jgi:cell division protein FtsI (penicillin-binding protein 3)